MSAPQMGPSCVASTVQPGGDDLTVDGTHLPEAGGRRQGAPRTAAVSDGSST